MSVNQVNQTTGALSPIAGGTLYADAPVGSIQAYGGAAAPWGWLLCQGQAISRTTYAELFGVIGTSFGSGDGSTTFNVPDLRETAPVGSGTRGSGVTTHDTYTVGQFKDDQIQEHTHLYYHIPQDTHSDLNVPSGAGYAYGNLFGYSTSTPNSGRHGDTTHGKQLGVNYIIKATTIALPSDFEAAVDEKIASVVKYGAFTGTSTASGNIVASTSLPVSSMTIISAWCETQGTLVIPSNNNGDWSFHVCYWGADMQAASTQSLTIRYAYIDK